MASEGVIEDLDVLAGMSASDQAKVKATQAAGIDPRVLPKDHPARRAAEARPRGSALDVVVDDGQRRVSRMTLAPGFHLIVVETPNGVAATIANLPV